MPNRRPRPTLRPMSRSAFALVGLSIVLGVAHDANAQGCSGKAYLESLTVDDVKFYHYTSDGFDMGGTWKQRNCVGLVNMGATPKSGIVATFEFASGQGNYVISTTIESALTGGDSASCLSTPTGGPNSNTVAQISPLGGALAGGAFTNACCFTFDAQAPTSLCESVPGPGDTGTATLDVGGASDSLTAAIRTTPQDAACGLVGLEALFPFAVALALRRARRGTRRRAPVGSSIRGATGVALALAVSGPAEVRAESFSLGAATDVHLTLEAIVTDTEEASLSGTLDVEVAIDGFGNPTALRFTGGAITVQPIALQATFGAVVDVEADLLTSIGHVESPWIPITPTGAGTGTFDVTDTDVWFEEGVIQASGPFFGATVGVNRNFIPLPLSMPNEHLTDGTIAVTPDGAGYDVVVELPIDVKSSLSYDTGGVWLEVNDGLLELEGDVGAAPVPVASFAGQAVLAGLLAWLGRRGLLRTRRR